MNLYMVKITTYAVVSANSENNAKEIAYDNKKSILDEDCNPVIEVCKKINNIYDLHSGWYGDCLPYGGEGFTTIKEILNDRLT